jgi:hypothetical protein
MIADALDRGDLEPWRKAGGRMSPEEKGMVWDMRQHVVAVGQRESAARPAVIPIVGKTSRIETRSYDLDYWPPDIEATDDEADDGQPCAACDGTGRDAAGNPCEACNGTGKASSDEDDEDDDDEFKDD